MNNTIRYFSITLLVLVSGSALAADAESIRHEIEVFLSSGIGNIVSIILLVLLLLWLLLPLAVFGLKSKIRKLTTETRETNRMLADVMETNKSLADTNDAGEILAHINETNRILADIRDELSVLNEEQVAPQDAGPDAVEEREEDTRAFYDEIKYEP